MPGNISNKNANPILIDRNEVIKITGYGGHGTISGGDAEVAELGAGVGQNRILYPAGNIKFIFNQQQTMLIRIDSLHGNIAQCKKQRCKSQIAPDSGRRVTQGASHINKQSFQGKKKRTDSKNATVRQNEILA